MYLLVILVMLLVNFQEKAAHLIMMHKGGKFMFHLLIKNINKVSLSSIESKTHLLAFEN